MLDGWIGIGMALGIVFGLIWENLGFGIGVGLGIAVVLWRIGKEKGKRKKTSQRKALP